MSRKETPISDFSQSIEKEFIEKYRKLPMLWDATHIDYTNRFKRLSAYNILVKTLKKRTPHATEFHVRQKINILRSCYRKDLRRHLSSETLMPDGEVRYSYVPTSWKFHAMRFLEKNSKEGSETDNIEVKAEENYNELLQEEHEVLQSDEDSYSNIEQNFTIGASVTLNTSEENNEVLIKQVTIQKKAKPESNEDKLINYEFRAVGNNVACKLKRMDPQQRYHAELLINKVLLNGLMDKLTDYTELTEVYIAESE